MTFCQVWEAGKLTFAHRYSPAKTSNAPAPPRTVRVSGASRKAGFGEGTPQQVSREEQNRRIADFGTVVETCSVTVADCPCLALPYIERTGRGLRPAVGGLFSFPLKIHFKGRQLPVGRGFSQIFFCLSNPGNRTLATGGAENFSFHSPHHRVLKFAKRGRQLFSGFIYLLRVTLRFCQMDNKKSSKSFSDLLLLLAAGGGWYLVLKVRARLAREILLC